MLAYSFLIELSSKLPVTRTGIKADSSLILGRIGPLILKLLALECKKFHTFELEYLLSQYFKLDQILCIASLRWRKGCIRFWGRLDQNSDFMLKEVWSIINKVTFHQNHIIYFNSLYNNIRMRWKWQGAKRGSKRDVGSLQDQDRGFCSTRLNSVSSQCARGKPSIARKLEDHPKIFKW